jgi:predicted ATP-grasp superfamily ATP-dependent carboligase
MAILAEADPRFPDARAAAELISHLNELLPAVELDQAPLIEEAERLEEQLKMMMETHLSAVDGGEPSAATSSMLYG